jgi:hypothetical protein
VHVKDVGGVCGVCVCVLFADECCFVVAWFAAWCVQTTRLVMMVRRSWQKRFSRGIAPGCAT